MSFCPLIGFRIIKRCQADLKPERFILIYLCIHMQHEHTRMECVSAAAVMDGWDILFRHFGSPKGKCHNRKDGYGQIASSSLNAVLSNSGSTLWSSDDLSFFSSVSSGSAASICVMFSSYLRCRSGNSDALILYKLGPSRTIPHNQSIHDKRVKLTLAHRLKSIALLYHLSACNKLADYLIGCLYE